MATFKRTGTIGTFKAKMIEGMVTRNYPLDFAERCFSQIEGFGEYGFPESHAASFALLVYASAWLKCRYPDVFAAALLNSQPMGFYAPAQIVRDVREHGIEVRPVDINHSDWDATLEPHSSPADRVHALHSEMTKDICSTHALRLGFRKIKGLSMRDARLIVAARRRTQDMRDAAREARYSSMRDLWLRTGLSSRIIARLADADAFGSLGLTRRQALWEAKALGRVGDKEDDLPLFRTTCGGTDPHPISFASHCEAKEIEPGSSPGQAIPLSGGGISEPQVTLPLMGFGEEVVNDYRFLELSLRAHPACFLRDDLTRRGIIRNEALRTRRSGEHVIVSGLVTIRQRPGTASGVIFMTIEDETAIANIIVWPKIFERFRAIILGARYLAVSGMLQHESGVIHVVAARLEDLTALLARLTEDSTPVQSLARADAIKHPHDENIDSRARGRRNPPRISAPAALPDLFASDFEVSARGSAHVPARRGGGKIR
jgi:error-prone DNA polymerase